MEVARAKAHRTKEEKEKMTQFERFVIEGNEKAGELANAGAMFEEASEVTAGTMKQERKEVYVALQYAASFHCSVEQWKDCEELGPKPKEKWSFVDTRSEGMKHRTEWCAEADRYRCMRCGRGRKYMKMPCRCNGTKFLSKSLKKLGRRHLGGHDLVRRMDTQGEVLIWCRKCSGYARQRMGPQQVNCCILEPMGTKEFGKMVKRSPNSQRRESPSQRGKELENRWRKEKSYEKRVSEAVEQF